MFRVLSFGMFRVYCRVCGSHANLLHIARGAMLTSLVLSAQAPTVPMQSEIGVAEAEFCSFR